MFCALSATSRHFQYFECNRTVSLWAYRLLCKLTWSLPLRVWRTRPSWAGNAIRFPERCETLRPPWFERMMTDSFVCRSVSGRLNPMVGCKPKSISEICAGKPLLSDIDYPSRGCNDLLLMAATYCDSMVFVIPTLTHTGKFRYQIWITSDPLGPPPQRLETILLLSDLWSPRQLGFWHNSGFWRSGSSKLEITGMVWVASTGL